MSTSRARRNSPRLFASASVRVDRASGTWAVEENGTRNRGGVGGGLMGGASTSPTARPGDHEVGKRHPECFRDSSERGELRQEPAAFDAVHGGARNACASGESALRQASDAANLSDLPADRCRRGNFACADLVGEVRIAFGPNEVPRQLDLVLAAGDRYLERH